VTDAPALNSLTDPGGFVVRYVPENLERFPGLDEAVKAFRAGDRPAARAAEAWLKAIDDDRVAQARAPRVGSEDPTRGDPDVDREERRAPVRRRGDGGGRRVPGANRGHDVRGDRPGP
jgi:hypothetical protein